MFFRFIPFFDIRPGSFFRFVVELQSLSRSGNEAKEDFALKKKNPSSVFCFGNLVESSRLMDTTCLFAEELNAFGISNES